MINIIKYKGGLGNQMFIYAFGLSLKSNNFLVLYDISDYKNTGTKLMIHNVFSEVRNVNRIKNKILNFICSNVVFRSHVEYHFENKDSFFKFEPQLIYNGNIFDIYDGFWQNETYFLNVKKQLKVKFSFDLNKLNKNTKFLLKRLEEEQYSVAMHIRRGDYLDDNNIKVFGNICSVEYYRKAISIISSKVSNFRLYVFSDDIKWAKYNFHEITDDFIDWNTNNDSWQDMFLMSKCKHNIISNSTFAWWAAWLNSNPNKIVVAPFKWTNVDKSSDIIPQDWIKIY